MLNPFDVVNQVSTSTQNNWGEVDKKNYIPFLINRALSYHHDTIMLANEVNMRHQMPLQWQYDFYRLAIAPKKKRFAKWSKPSEDELVELISSTYQVNRQKAISIRSLLNSNDINNLRTITERGGR